MSVRSTLARTTLALGAALALAGCINIDLVSLTGGSLEETTILGEGRDKILLVELDGAMAERGESSAFGLASRESPVSRMRGVLERAALDDDVRAVVLRINSPGGTVNASEILYGEVQRFKAEHDLPVIAQMMGVAASGGYYVAMASDYVQAYPTTVTGSIGVVLAGVNASGLMEKIGLANQTLTTGAFKDAGSPLRPMADAEREQLASVLDDLFVRFLDVVEAGRPALDRARIEQLADGRIYSARQALDAGLIDAIGDLPAAIEIAKQRAGIERARVITYRRPNERRENLFSSQVPVPEPLGAQGLLAELARPAFLYLWTPGAR
jgi:protease-4